MFYNSEIQTIMPKEILYFEVEIIRPLYYVREYDIIRWKNRNNLDFVNYSCDSDSKECEKKINSEYYKKKEIKLLINKLKENYENIDINIFRSVQNVNLDTIISYIKNGNLYSFLDKYNKF